MRFDTRIKMGEDRIFLIQYLNECNKAELVKESLYHYRKEREDSACTSKAITIGLDYEHETNKWRLKKETVENNNKLSAWQKEILNLFLDHEYYIGFVYTQIKNNPNYKEVLKEYHQDIDNARIRKNLTVRKLRKTGHTWKDIFLILLIKCKMFFLIRKSYK